MSERPPSQFQFYEMRKLIGGQHDTDFSVTATAQGIHIHRPDELNEDLEDPDPVPNA